MVKIENMLAKQHVESNRLTQLVSFVDAHFDNETGKPVSGGFFEVLNRLGRADLDFGAELQGLGALSPSEKEHATVMYSKRLGHARNPDNKKRIIFKSEPLWSDVRANPFYKQLSPIDRLIFEALDPTGLSVVNPAAATTLAQAALESWFDVPQLLLTPTALLSQASEQGDSHAAYLLATAHTLTGIPLLSTETDRQTHVEFVSRLGHIGAREKIADNKWLHGRLCHRVRASSLFIQLLSTLQSCTPNQAQPNGSLKRQKLEFARQLRKSP